MTDLNGQKTQGDALEDVALDWLTRLTSGEVTTDELEALQHWRQQNPAHEAAFVRAGKLWHSVKPAVETVAWQEPPARSRPTSGMGRRAVIGGALAASAAYLVVRSPFDLWPSISELTSDYRTGTGQQRRITTAGGVKVALNTQTSIDVGLTADGSERIELISGEAMIATGGNSTRSIVALAGNGRAIATDAAFNIRRTALSAYVTCMAGSVVVEQRGEAVTLGPNQQVSCTDEGLAGAIKVDPASITAWQEGILVFHGEPLGHVIDEINRYWHGRIIVASAGLGKRPVTARFKIDHLEDAITQIRLVFHADVTRLPGGIVLLSS